MTPPQESRGTVVTYSCRASRAHESVTLRELARRLAAIKGYDFAEEFNCAHHYTGPLYFVPNVTLVGPDTSQKIGIRNEQGLFGGDVPFAFGATNTITHPLPAAD